MIKPSPAEVAFSLYGVWSVLTFHLKIYKSPDNLSGVSASSSYPFGILLFSSLPAFLLFYNESRR